MIITVLQKLWKIFLVFAKIGAFTFGGGYAMIPLIQKEIVEKQHWATDEEVLDMFAIAESTPGVIAVNTATFSGYKVAGVWGALVATVAIAAPAFLIISVISVFFTQFLALEWVGYAFSGIRVAVVVLMINAGIKLGKVNQKNVFNILLTVIAALLSAFTSVNVIFILIGAMLIGIICSLFSQKKKSSEGTN
ncbi:MAG: chromate transporter [Clostridiales bacterium]|nr:chromate transporter [Clostridiales bacterium]